MSIGAKKILPLLSTELLGVRVIRSLLGGEGLLIVCGKSTLWWSRVRWGLCRIARGHHLLLLRRRIVASRWRLKTSWGCLIASRLLRRVSTTTSMLQLVARRLQRLVIGGATLQRLACSLMNLPPIPEAGTS